MENRFSHWTLNLLFVLLFAPHLLLAQASNLVVEPELIIGRIVPNYQNYPSAGLIHGIGVSLHASETQDKVWQQHFPNAEVGLFLGFWNMGNDSIFGNELAAYPYVQFPLKKHRKSPLHMRIGLGAAYFTKFYSTDKNIRNTAVGSPLTWAFEAGLMWKKPLTKRLDLTLSGKYLHGSNGHIQLPNFGINSAAFGCGVRYHPVADVAPSLKPKLARFKHHHFQVKTELGIHELGGTIGPVGGPKYGILGLAAYRNIQYNRRNRMKFGLIFRQYNSYATYISQNDLAKDINPNSLSFALGHEFLMGHVGLDVDGLLHLYKPFYRTYYTKFAGDSQLFFLLHRWLGARIGLNLYVVPPSLNPKTNVFLGVHLNTNNGEADFSSITLGLERLIR